MSRENEGAMLPAVPEGRFYTIVSPKGPGVIRAVLLADTFTGYWTHWDRCALPCLHNSDCPRCAAGMPNRWTGYIAVYDVHKQNRAILALSEGAARQLLKLAEEYGTLRGVTVEVRRQIPTKPNSPVVVTGWGVVEGKQPIWEHPITDSLNRLWGLNEQYAERCKPARERRQSDGLGRGVPIPRDDFAADYKAPTPAQRQRLREVVGGIGEADF